MPLLMAVSITEFASHFSSAIVKGMKTLIAFVLGPMEILIVGCILAFFIAAIVAIVKVIRRP